MITGSVILTTGLRVTAAEQQVGAARRTHYSHGTGVQHTTGYGTGSGYADCFVNRKWVLAAGDSVTWDLWSSSALLDIFDDDIALRLVRDFAVWVEDGGDTSGVRVGGAASNPWQANFADTSDMALIYPDGAAWTASKPGGMTVSTTARNLKVENLGAVQVTLRVVCAASRSGGGGAVFGLPGMTYP